MKKTRLFIVPVFVSLLLSGCSDLFFNNLFRSLEDTKMTIDENTDVEDIEEYSDNPEFYSDLKNDPEKKQEVVEILNEAIDTGESDEVQTASLLLADVYVQTDEHANEAIVNALSVETDYSSISETAAVSEIVAAILPDEIQPPEGAEPGSPAYEAAEAAFIETIASLANAGAAYEAFGAALESDGEGGYVPPDNVNIGEVTQSAIVCIATEALLSGVADANGYTQKEAAEALFDYLFGSGEDPIASGSITDIDLEEEMQTGSALSNILSAAGMSMDDLPIPGAGASVSEATL